VRISADCYRLRLVKPKRIFLPLSLSFLLIFSMKVLRLRRGFSATFGSFLFSLADTGLIIAYVRGQSQYLSTSPPLSPPVVFLPTQPALKGFLLRKNEVFPGAPYFASETLQAPNPKRRSYPSRGFTAKTPPKKEGLAQ